MQFNVNTYVIGSTVSTAQRDTGVSSEQSYELLLVYSFKIGAFMMLSFLETAFINKDPSTANP